MLAISLAARLAVAWDVSRFELGRDREVDMAAYAEAADMVLAGDLLLRGASRAVMFREYVEGVGRARLERRVGREPFMHAPLYTWFVAAVRWTGGGPDRVRAAQALLATLALWLAWRLAARVSGSERVALLALVLLALHPLPPLLAAFVLRETLLGALTLALALAAARLADRPGLAAGAVAGALLGLLHLGRATSLLLAPLLLVALGLAWRASSEGAWRRAAAGVALGLAALLAPLAARNAAAGCPPLHSEGVVPWAIVAFNAPGTPPDRQVEVPFPFVAAMWERSDGGDLDLYLETLALHPRPLDAAHAVGRRLAAFTGGGEPPNITDLDRLRAVVPSLALFPLGSVVLVPLGLLGLVAALPRWRRWWPVALPALATAASIATSVALDRYRAPALPFLAIGAAWALDRLVRAWREGPRALRWRWTAAATGVVAALGVGNGYTPLHPRPARHVLLHAYALQHARLGDRAGAARHALRALEALPPDAPAGERADLAASARRLALEAGEPALAARAEQVGRSP